MSSYSEESEEEEEPVKGGAFYSSKNFQKHLYYSGGDSYRYHGTYNKK